jgi:hypothetical protein
VPLDIALRTASDAGQPGTGKQAEVFAEIARGVAVTVGL